MADDDAPITVSVYSLEIAKRGTTLDVTPLLELGKITVVPCGLEFLAPEPPQMSRRPGKAIRHRSIIRIHPRLAVSLDIDPQIQKTRMPEIPTQHQPPDEVSLPLTYDQGKFGFEDDNSSGELVVRSST